MGDGESDTFRIQRTDGPSTIRCVGGSERNQPKRDGVSYFAVVRGRRLEIAFRAPIPFDREQIPRFSTHSPCPTYGHDMLYEQRFAGRARSLSNIYLQRHSNRQSRSRASAMSKLSTIRSFYCAPIYQQYIKFRDLFASSESPIINCRSTFLAGQRNDRRTFLLLARERRIRTDDRWLRTCRPRGLKSTVRVV